MAGRGGQLARWELVQMRSFGRWMNSVLAEADRGWPFLVGNRFEFQEGFKDGTRLWDLLEALSGKDISNVRLKGTGSRFVQLQNNTILLNAAREMNVKIVGCSPDDLTDGNFKCIMGFVWGLILRFQVNEDEDEEEEGEEEGEENLEARSTDGTDSPKPLTPKPETPREKKKKVAPKVAMLNYASEAASAANVEVVDYKESFNTGMVVCAMVNDIKAGLIDIESLDPENNVYNCNLGITTAEDQLGIPRIIDPEDMAEGADELSLVTYVSFFAKKKRDMERTERKNKTKEKMVPEPEPTKEPEPEPEPVPVEREAVTIKLMCAPGLAGSFSLSVKPTEGSEVLEGGEKAVIEERVIETESGVYAVSFEAAKNQTYAVSVSLAGYPVPGSPFQCKVG